MRCFSIHSLICAAGIISALPHSWGLDKRGSAELLDRNTKYDSKESGIGPWGATSHGTVTRIVMVGGDAGLVFTPSFIQASMYDVIEFVFQKKNHTLTQSSFGSPCIALPGGTDSGYRPNPDGTADPPPTFRYTVETVDPTWWFCKQGNHCQQGMVFAINPSENKTFDVFQKRAMSQSNDSKTSPPVAASIGSYNTTGLINPLVSSDKNKNTPGLVTATLHNVMVGGDAGLVYTPSSVKAAVGDIINFVFEKQNHTVTQSTFKSPCDEIDDGIDSGYLANLNNSISPPPCFQYIVTDLDPTWWYCKQQGHCASGMVFAINPTSEETIEMFIQTAMESKKSSSTRTLEAASTPVENSDGLGSSLESYKPSTTLAEPSYTTSLTENTAIPCNCKDSSPSPFGGIVSSVTVVIDEYIH